MGTAKPGVGRTTDLLSSWTTSLSRNHIAVAGSSLDLPKCTIPLASTLQKTGVISGDELPSLGMHC